MRWFNRKTLLILALAAAGVAVAWQWRLSEPRLLADLRDLTFDTYQRIKPRERLGQPIRIIDIDEASIETFGQWPWPRTLMAQMVDRLGELGAATIAFDIVFSEPDRTGPKGFIDQLRQRQSPLLNEIKGLVAALPDNDLLFEEALATTPVVLGFFPDATVDGELPRKPPGIAVAGNEQPHDAVPSLSGAVMNLPALQEKAAGVGAITLTHGNDDVVRRVPMLWSNGKNFYPALSIETLRVAQNRDSYVLRTTSGRGGIAAGKEEMDAIRVGQFEVPTDETGALQLYFAREDPAIYLSATDLMNRPAGEVAPLVEGHIVFVGASAIGLRDQRVTALGDSVPGVSMHAQAVDQMLSGSFLTRPDWAQGAEIATMIVLTLLIVAILPIAGSVLSAIFGGVCALVIVSASWVAFSRYGLLIDPLFPLATGTLIFLVTTILLFAFAEKEKRFVRGAFQRYLAPDLLNQLERDPRSLKLGGEIRDLTLMFMDVRGFTPISEKLNPEELVGFLNQLLSPLSDTIQNHEGAIDKYIGDSIMAFWNAPLPVENHPAKAARAALSMLAIVEKLNTEDAFGFAERGIDIDGVQIGIGINTGEGCVGNMGSSTRFNYSVVGDTVNIAARIESSCKDVGWPVLLSEATALACEGFAMLEAGSIPLKGKSRPLPLHALIGDEQLAATEDWQKLRRLHQELIAALKDGKEEFAGELKGMCLELAPKGLEPFYENLVGQGFTAVAAQ